MQTKDHHIALCPTEAKHHDVSQKGKMLGTFFSFMTMYVAFGIRRLDLCNLVLLLSLLVRCVP